MPICCHETRQATTEYSPYRTGGGWVVCAEVFVSTNESTRPGSNGQPAFTALELMNLPREVRRGFLTQAADLAARDYESDVSLTGFEAFGDTDLYDETG